MTSDRILYLECCSGISGDMTVAALLDLGADEKKLREALASLPLEGYQIQISRVKKSGLDACDFAVLLDEEHENHDHDMRYLHGDLHGDHKQEGYMQEEHLHGSHVHEEHFHDDHDHDGHACAAQASHHSHTHRGLPEITQIIEAGTLTVRAKELALRIFDILADAEAKAHGMSRDEVHFHEVGAVDSIVDIVAVAVCLDDLEPEQIVLSPLSEGTGTVRCQHGILPIPVPAVTNIVTAYGLPVHNTTVQGELVTPTGAAIAAAVMQEHKHLPEDYTIERVGIGAGKRDYATAGILRAMWIRPFAQEEKEKDEEGGRGGSTAERDRIVKLEANIDDATGEQLGYCMECLMEAGARDVSFVPLYMKKNRPAYEVHVICDPCDISCMEEILFRETTTIGVRRCVMERTVMDRSTESVETPFGTARVKVCSYGSIRKVYPEYESVRSLCRESKMDFRNVYQVILDTYE
ncbi:MAG: nickel pincer cofactor biosynthesis protein LarC [Lachnospiraceae bacterium]|nr:nickel pincer cofactor biosynthesis protein LarC [bacterium]MDY5516999.1 nickel pincer cofactor biosynthesis protein LarC [Lachnospiraceae bacterium]